MPSEADRAALALPCRDQPHDPYLLDLVEVGDGRTFVHARVRTTSSELDGCGGRTDVHEILGVLWAAVLRANGAASAQIVDIANLAPEEIYVRGLVMRQPFDSFLPSDRREALDLLRAHSALAAHRLAEICRFQDSVDAPPDWFNKAPPWLDAVRALVKVVDAEELYGVRWNPDWFYWKPYARGPIVVEFHPETGAALRFAFRHYRPRSFRLGDVLVAAGLRHAIPMRALRLGARLLAAVDGSEMAKWRDGGSTFGDDALMLVPIESHCVLIGWSSVVVVRADCGLNSFISARRRWEDVRSDAMSVFGQSGSFSWAASIDSEQFANLVRDLLEADPTNLRAQTTGSHNDRDQGRDIIVERRRIRPGIRLPEVTVEKVVVQVKVRSKPVGKSQVKDIVDTIRRHSANAYLLVAYPSVTGSFVDFAESVRSQDIHVEWWGRAEIEERLRANQHLAERYANLVRYSPPVD